MSKTPTLASVNGTTLSGAQLKTFLTGIVAAFRTNGMQETDRATITSSTTLTVQNCGLVLVDCTAGNVTLTLPTSGSTTDDAIYNIRRLDGTSNTLTLARGGSDTIEGSSSLIPIGAKGNLAIQLPAGGTDWKITGVSSPAHGRCRLSYQSSTALILTPYNGNTIIINGQVVTIPSAGVTLSNSGMSAFTLYYIYAYLSSGVLTLERSTTGHSTDAATGVEIKTGDSTRTLVGMARSPNTVWVMTSNYVGVISYFNRREVLAAGYFASTLNSANTSYLALGAGGTAQCDWLTWADEPVKFSVNGFSQNLTSGQLVYTSLGVDGTTAQDVFNLAVGTDGGPLGFMHANSFSEGYHYSTVLGKVAGGTGSWSGGSTAGERTTHQAIVMG